MLKSLIVWITTNCVKFLEMRIPDHLTCLLRHLYAGQEAAVRNLRGTMDWFKIQKGVHSVQFSSVAQSCPTLCNRMNRSSPASLSITNSRSSLRLRSIESVMPSSHLILCRPLLLPPPIPTSIRVFSNEFSG